MTNPGLFVYFRSFDITIQFINGCYAWETNQGPGADEFTELLPLTKLVFSGDFDDAGRGKFFINF